MKLEKFLLNSKIEKILEIMEGNLNRTFKPSKLMIQNVLDILKDRTFSKKEKVTYEELVYMCETYISEVDIELEPDVDKFIREIEQIIKEWYGDCPRSMAFVSKVIAAYRKHIGEIVIDDK